MNSFKLCTRRIRPTYLLKRVFFFNCSRSFGLIFALDSSILDFLRRCLVGSEDFELLELRLPLAKNTVTVLNMTVFMCFLPPPPLLLGFPAPPPPPERDALLLLLLTPWGVGILLTPDVFNLVATVRNGNGIGNTYRNNVHKSMIFHLRGKRGVLRIHRLQNNNKYYIIMELNKRNY